MPEAFGEGVISHNDPNLDNVIFAGERAVALIDFDLAGPGSAVWDVACAARLWAPLRDERDAPAPARATGALERLRLFVDAYGLAGPRPRAGRRRGRGPRTSSATASCGARSATGTQTFGHKWDGGGVSAQAGRDVARRPGRADAGLLRAR